MYVVRTASYKLRNTVLNLRFALVTYFCVRSLRTNPRSPCLACFSEPVVGGYASHYGVALRQPSVIYVKVNSVRFSSRSLYCSHLQGVMGRGSVPHAPRSARISEPVLGVLCGKKYSRISKG